MIKKFKKYFWAVPIILAMVLMASSALAQLPPGNPITIDDISGLVGTIARFMIAISMVVAVIFIVLSGIMTMMAQADPGKFTNGLLRLKHAIIGAMVILATGVIINTVAAIVDRSFFCQLQVLFICLY